MYELVILGLLMRWPAHGYFIANVINDMIGPYARLSNGPLYPLLAKLEQEGLIVSRTSTEETPRGEWQVRSYEITAAGREPSIPRPRSSWRSFFPSTMPLCWSSTLSIISGSTRSALVAMSW
jgi:hypothetical protein